MNIKCVLLLSVVVFYSCSAVNKVSPVDYVKWVEDENNGLKRTKEIGDYIFELQYQPLEYMALREVKDINNVTSAEMDSVKNQLSGLDYYKLKIKSVNDASNPLSTGLGSNDKYYYRLEYFANEVKNDLSLVNGNDTILCALHHFEYNHNIVPYHTILIGFENNAEQKIESRTFIYNDKILGTGAVKFIFDKNDLENIPGLSLKN
ncbi:MAG: hypothetical protein AB7G44_06270 [Bacteroidia bacterium]